jgi:hypothetical protein
MGGVIKPPPISLTRYQFYAALPGYTLRRWSLYLGRGHSTPIPPGPSCVGNSWFDLFCSRSKLSKCTPPWKFEPHVSVAGLFTSGRPNPLVGKREIWVGLSAIRKLTRYRS